MMFLNLTIPTLAKALEDYGFSGGSGIGVTFSDTAPNNPQGGQLWLSSLNNELKVYNGTDWQFVSLTTDEKTQLGTLATAVTSASTSATIATNAANKITGMVVNTGAEGTQATWNPTTGVLTIPRGATGATGAIGATGSQGVQGVKGDKGDTGTGLVVKGTDTAANIILKSGVEGDFWIASDTGDGYSYVGGSWVNTGQIKGDKGDTGATGAQGIQGIKGDTGDAGRSITGVARTGGNGSAGTTDTYTIYYSDTTTSTFNVYNGANGAVMSVAGKAGDVVLTKSDVGLSNVDNTSDANKPVSTATQTALNGKSDTTHSHTSLTGLTVTGLKETKVVMAANNIDLANGNLFTKTISGATTLTVSNVPTTGTVGYLILELTNGGSATITWFSGVKWAGGTAPTLTSAGKDIISMYTHDGGTTWNVNSIQKDVK